MFPLWYVLIIFGLFAFLSGIFVIINVLHIYKYGMESKETVGVIIMYILGYSIIFSASFLVLSTIDWSISFTANDIFSSFLNIGNSL